VPDLVEGVQRAVTAYRDPAQWRRLQMNGMAKNFGWGDAARAYAAIYGRIKATS
jgi:starch synthase